jgi:hypothetical protein
MYCLSEEQIGYILNDIRARGVELEDLQSNLLDHICCIIEENLKEGEDFESFYQQTISRFYKKDLLEIEEETITLIIFKNYYAMKKAMLISGLLSTFFLSTGIVLKFLQAPGGSVGLVLGMVTLSLVFLPLLFTLKAREKKSAKEKLIIGLGTFAAILMCLSILFKVMHWPWSLWLGLGSVFILILFFLPVYLVSGLRNPDTKVNAIVSSILLIGGCGMFLSLVSMKRIQGTVITDISLYTNNEVILKAEQRNVANLLSHNNSTLTPTAQRIIALCEDLKSLTWENETGFRAVNLNAPNEPALHRDYDADFMFKENADALSKFNELVKTLQTYNSNGQLKSLHGFVAISFENTILQYTKNKKIFFQSLLTAMSNFSQIEMTVLQNEAGALALK